MMIATKVFGISLEFALSILLALIVVISVVLVFTVHKLVDISRRYYAVTHGKSGRDLESTILMRFQEMDKVKAMTKRMRREHVKFKGHLDNSYDRIGYVPYNSFDNLSGEQSFAFALLNEHNDGIVINSMYTKNGCFVFSKQIAGGHSDKALTREEQDAISIAMQRNYDNTDDTDTEKTKSVSKKKNTDLDKEVNPSKSLTKAKPSLNKSKAVKAERNARPIRTQIADTEINEDLF